MRRKNEKQIHTTGFTIVELLIVIVVIGILAAITIVAYNGIQAKGHDVSIQADLRNIATKAKLYMAENSEYPYTFTHFSTMGIKVSKNSYEHYFNGTAEYNLVYCYAPSTAPTSFAIVGYGKGKSWMYTGAGEIREFTSAPAGSVTDCAAAGVTLQSGADRFWFYDNNAWRSFV